MKSKILCVVFGLFLLVTFSGTGWSGDVTYPIMKPDRDTRLKWMEAYKNTPPAFIDEKLMERIPLTGSLSLLSHIDYVPVDRDQGNCGNCWAWAGTGMMEIARSVQNTVKERLSIQYVNSCKSGDYACCGAFLDDLVSFYEFSLAVIPWSNTSASFQDGGRVCADGSSLVSCASISTNPSTAVLSIANTKITTQGVGQATAISNIKNVLSQSKGVWYAFYLADDTDWGDFYSFWNTDSEIDIWDPDSYSGHTWVDTEGGGHAVLIVGYDDDDGNENANPYWIVLNSWGTTTGRPNGLYRLDMNIDHDGYFYDPSDGKNYYSHYFETLDVEFYECSAGQLLANNQAKLNILRKTRDIKMASTTLGASLVGLYYRYTGEVSRILRADKGLKIMATNVMEKMVEKAALLNNGEKVSIDRGLVGSVLELANAINANASPDLKMAIKKVKGEIIKGTIFRQLGVAVK